MNLQARVLIVLLLVGLLSGGVTGGLLVRASSEVVLDAGRVMLEEEASNELERIRGELRQLEGDVRFLAATPPIQGLRRARAHGGVDPWDASTEEQWKARLVQLFSEMLAAHPSYVQARLVGREDGGRELVRVERTVGGLKVVDTLQQKGAEPYFREVFEVGEGQVYASAVTLNREEGRFERPLRPVLRMAMAVPGDDGPFGFVILNVDARDLLQPASVHPTFLADGEGQVLFHPQPGVAFRHELFPEAPVPREVERLQPMLRGEVEVRPLRTLGALQIVRRVGYGAAPHRRHLGLVIGQTVPELTRSYREALNGLVASLLLFALVAVGLSWWLARFAAGPVRRLTDAVERLDGEGRSWTRPEGLDAQGALLADALEHAFSKLAERSRELQRANQDLAAYTHAAAHRLQEPARRLALFGELLRQVHGEDEPLLAELEGEARQLQEQLRALIRYSELVGGDTSLPVDLKRLGDRVLDDLQERIRESGADVAVDLSGELPGDERQLAQLLRELLENALQHARPDEVPRVRVTARWEGAYVLLTVVDHGRGVPEAERERVFELFTDLSERPGRGVGLATARRIAELHGGSLHIGEPPAGGGTTFVARLRG